MIKVIFFNPEKYNGHTFSGFRVNCGLVWLGVSLHVIKQTQKMLRAENIHLKLILITTLREKLNQAHGI